ncbi:hypothetical protein GI482_07465 [Bacillus sp. N3536]|nr:hypothetical protein GI482_07465 [Bacillus sp. N3536]
MFKMGTGNKKIIEEFLSYPDNKKLFEDYQYTKSQEIKNQLDNEFKKFYQNIRILSYVIKVLHYESKRFDQKERLHRSKNILSLDSDDKITVIYHERFFTDFIGFSDDIADHISSEKLFFSIRKLSERQKKILSLVFVKQMTDREIASYFGISQQAVSKSRRNIIDNIRKELTYD